MRLTGLEAAERFVFRHHPHCTLAVLGGSGGRRQDTAGSDLDLVIVDDEAPWAYRKTLREEDWLVEQFVLTSDSFRDLFDAGVHAANPTLQRMLTEGVLLRCEEAAERILKEAQDDLAAGPMPWSSGERDAQRYWITDLWEDVKDASCSVEQCFALHRLTIVLSEFHLRVNKQWIAEGKHLYRELKAFDGRMASALEQALQTFYGQGDLGAYEEVVAATLAPYGGLLREGYEE
ncbi:nucleotidyltransferase domain-containing protein [Paenibacillus sp. CC-CFT747]|nr:nucleotidyltransferase domain-containing protein [Paenibacillus sp. CC-CFT747]